MLPTALAQNSLSANVVLLLSDSNHGHAVRRALGPQKAYVWTKERKAPTVSPPQSRQLLLGGLKTPGPSKAEVKAKVIAKGQGNTDPCCEAQKGSKWPAMGLAGTKAGLALQRACVVACGQAHGVGFPGPQRGSRMASDEGE